MNIRSWAAAAAALLAGAGAHAQTTAVFDLTNGAFSNAYAFSVSGPATVVGDTNSSGVTWFGALLQNQSATYSALDPNPDDGFSFAGLPAGNYTLSFVGSGRGGYGGYYTVTTTVPEPQSYALLLAGLGAIGFVAARRRG